MSRLAEETLILHLTDAESLEVLASEGLDPEVITTPELRPVVQWAVEYFFDSGLTSAPSQRALEERYRDVIDDAEIDLDSSIEDTIEWAIDDLKSSYAYSQVGTFNRTLAKAMAEADPGDRIDVVNAYATELIGLAVSLESDETQIDARVGLDSAVREYERRAETPDDLKGLCLGVPPIDAYTHRVRPGELAILAAGPKVGKSWFMDWVALSDWEAGGTPALFTLENTVPETLDRLACMASHVRYDLWQSAQLGAEDVALVKRKVAEFADSDHPLWVLQPELGRCSVEAIVQQAKVIGADSILIDQLSHVELAESRKPQHERIGDALRVLHKMISSGRDKKSCLIAHQMSREGVKRAEKDGFHRMYDLAESAQIERVADWVFALFCNRAERMDGIMKFQTLASRRAALKHWMLDWNVTRGSVLAYREIELDVA